MTPIFSRFGYLPLQRSSGPVTRILLLGHGDISTPLSVTLQEQHIENCLGYEALSYVWGDAVSPNPILRDGKKMEITANLDSALRSLRYPDRTRRLWVDAICINQKDDLEKSSQIPLMKLIYRHATRVIVWLGPMMPGVREAFDLAGQLARKRAGLNYTANDNTRVSPAAGHNLNPESVRDIFPPDSPTWKFLSDILAVSWWERIWCIQELVVSSPVIARCGNLETPMVNLLASTTYISYWRTRLNDEEYEATTLNKKYANLWFWNDVYLEKFREPPNSPAHWRQGRRIINLLPVVRQFKCSNPRDRVFALLAIIREKPGGFGFGGDMWNVIDGDVGAIRSKWTELADNFSGLLHGRDEIMDRHMRRLFQQITKNLLNESVET